MPALPPKKVLSKSEAAKGAAAPARVVLGDRPAPAEEVSSVVSGDRPAAAAVEISSGESGNRFAYQEAVDQRPAKSSESASLERLRLITIKKKQAQELEIQVLELDEKLSQSVDAQVEPQPMASCSCSMCHR